MITVKKIEQLRLIEDELKKKLCFAKRRNGLIKKALELHMVCDVDALFISFSPSGRLSYFCGDKRYLKMNIIRNSFRFLNVYIEFILE